MSTNTTNMAMGKAVDGDNAKTYLETTLGAALDTVDAHRHQGGTSGLIINTIPSGGLTVTAGNVGIGIAPSSQSAITVNGLSLTGAATTQGVFMSVVGASDSTTEVSAFTARANTGAAATYTTLAGFHALNHTKFAGSTITSAYGLLVDAITVGGTNNYGIYVNAPSGGSNNNVGIAIDYPSGGSISRPLYFLNVGTNPIFRVNSTTKTSIGATGGAAALPANPAEYLLIDMSGVTRAIPCYNP